MKSKNGWQEWSNGYITLYYLDDDQVSFLNAQIDNDVSKMLRYSVAETKMDTGLMKRTDYGRQLFRRHVRTTDTLTMCVREMKI